jgi:transcriptional regulator with XRE-family HTH domain
MMLEIREKFEILLDLYRRPDGKKWNTAELERATGGFLNRSYVTNLRKGRIKQPRLEKLQAIAKAMGFPPEFWFSEPEEWSASGKLRAERVGGAISERLNHLFEITRNERTQEPFTNAEVANLSGGRLSEAEVEDLRSGKLTDPTIAQLLALSEIFEVDQSYWFMEEERPPLLDREALEALRDETAQKILHKSLRLSERDKNMLLLLAEQMNLDAEDGAEDRG